MQQYIDSELLSKRHVGGTSLSMKVNRKLQKLFPFVKTAENTEVYP